MTVDGVTYDSQKEYRRWVFLTYEQKAGKIRDLKHHVSFSIEVNGSKICRYIADFVYETSEGVRVIEDVKSPITRTESTYRLKAKLMAATHGKITEV